MSRTIERPMAFHHRDGLVAAWRFASKYATTSGHIATLPEIVELRIGSDAEGEDSAWRDWYTSTSAEYFGIGADGRIKIIVAHGVGPMSNIDGIKTAYKWEWGDKSRRKRGGRITAQQFLDLESGKYGMTRVFSLSDFCKTDGGKVYEFDVEPVNILDFQDYVEAMSQVRKHGVFYNYLTSVDALNDPLMWMRLGSKAYDYLTRHEIVARVFHVEQRPNSRDRRTLKFDESRYPFITSVRDASNCPYTLPNREALQATGRIVEEPRVPEEGYAFAHLLAIDPLTVTLTQDIGVALMAYVDVHEWHNPAKFVAVPNGASMSHGLRMSPDLAKVIRDNRERFMQTVENGYTPVTPFKLRCVDDEFFAEYPKAHPGESCIDDGDIEFCVKSVKRVGHPGTFETDELFFLRYKLSQIKAIMPAGANAYEIVNISKKNNCGVTTVTVIFYLADVDTSLRLPHIKDVDRDLEQYFAVLLLDN